MLWLCRKQTRNWINRQFVARHGMARLHALATRTTPALSLIPGLWHTASLLRIESNRIEIGVVKTLKPDNNGTKRRVEIYGDDPAAVRYRLNPQQQISYTTSN